jgi:dTDP-3,4-didehydro-2,6-dideoxy-alpha-D-glucose 3-reductase
MRKVNVGLVSVGSHCMTNILPALSSMENVDIKGFFTRSEKTRASVSDSYSIESFTNIEALLSSTDLNFVYISSPNSQHYLHVRKALEYGANVIVEKTAVDSLERSVELKSIANRNGLVIYEAFMYKHHSQFLRLKEIVDKKIYGCPRKVFINFGFPHLRSDDIRYSKPLSGGALMDAGAYTLSAAQELFSGLELVYSSISRREHDVDLDGTAILIAADGTECFLNWGFGFSYKNEIVIWTDDEWVTAERAFSKPSELRARITHGKNGKSGVDSDPCSNHFVQMFDYVFDIPSKRYPEVNEKLVTQMKFIDKIFKDSR